MTRVVEMSMIKAITVGVASTVIMFSMVVVP